MFFTYFLYVNFDSVPSFYQFVSFRFVMWCFVSFCFVILYFDRLVLLCYVLSCFFLFCFVVFFVLFSVCIMWIVQTPVKVWENAQHIIYLYCFCPFHYVKFSTFWCTRRSFRYGWLVMPDIFVRNSENNVRTIVK